MPDFMFERVNTKALGQLLLEKGAISERQLDEALEYGRVQGIRLGEALKKLGFVSQDYITYALGEQFGLFPIQLSPSMLDKELINRFPMDLLRKYQMIPFVEVGDEIVVLISDPNNIESLKLLGTYVPTKRITPQLGDSQQILSCIDFVDPHAVQGAPQSNGTSKQPEGTQPVTPWPQTGPAPEPGTQNFANWLLSNCLQSDDSDLIIRFDNRIITIYNQTRILTPSQQTASTNTYEFSGTIFPAIMDELLSHCTHLEPGCDGLYRWKAPLRFAGKRYTIQIAISYDLTGMALTLRPLHLLEIPQQPYKNMREANRRLTLSLFGDLDAMQDFITFTSLSTPTPPLLIYRTLRSVMRGTTAYPAAFYTPAVLASHFEPHNMFFDYAVDLQTLAEIYQGMKTPPNIHICTLTGEPQLEFGLSKHLEALLDTGIFTTDYRTNPNGETVDARTLKAQILATGGKS